MRIRELTQLSLGRIDPFTVLSPDYFLSVNQQRFNMGNNMENINEIYQNNYIIKKRMSTQTVVTQ